MFFEEIKLGEHFGFDMFPKPMGPFPPDYDGGFHTTIGILSRINRLGRHEEKQKLSSSRKARSVHANVFMASDLGGAISKSVRSNKGHQSFTSPPTDTEWFNRFTTGLWARIGERRRQDAAISISLMLEMQKRLDARWTRAVVSRDTLEMHCVAETGSFFILTYCGSLRGFETPKVVLSDLTKHTLSPE
jgi:hypothetical protein